MKKVIYSILPLFIFMIYTNVHAAENACPLKDSTTWEYQTTKYSIHATEDKALYDTSECCYTENEVYAWDYYNQINENNSNQNSTSTNYCSGLKDTFTIIGHIVRLAKILIPIVIIGFGMLDLFKAVVGSKDDEIKKSFKSLIMRCIAGVCIFFLPAFIDLIFSWVDGWETNYQGSYEECFKCIWDVGSCK